MLQDKCLFAFFGCQKQQSGPNQVLKLGNIRWAATDIFLIYFVKPKSKGKGETPLSKLN